MIYNIYRIFNILINKINSLICINKINLYLFYVFLYFQEFNMEIQMHTGYIDQINRQFNAMKIKKNLLYIKYLFFIYIKLSV